MNTDLYRIRLHEDWRDLISNPFVLWTLALVILFPYSTYLVPLYVVWLFIECPAVVIEYVLLKRYSDPIAQFLDRIRFFLVPIRLSFGLYFSLETDETKRLRFVYVLCGVMAAEYLMFAALATCYVIGTLIKASNDRKLSSTVSQLETETTSDKDE